jgi:hypothetical protein
VSFAEIKQKVWDALPLIALGFLLGFICTSTTTYADRSLELQTLELDVARNSEKIRQLQMDCQAIHDWIAASDRQAVRNAEEEGGYHAKTEAHEKGLWLVIGQGLVLLVLAIETIVRRSKGKADGLDK